MMSANSTFAKMKTLFTLLSSILICSCSNWHYDANFISRDNTEQIDFKGDGYDLFYGPAKMTPYSISYPDSARDPSTNKVHVEDFSSFIGGKNERLSNLSGFIVVEPNKKVEVRLESKLTRRDGSIYTSELPINGEHKLKDNQ